MYRYIKWLGVACLSASVFFSGCGSDKKDISKAPLVKTMVIGEMNDSSGANFSGMVHGGYESPLAFQLGGRVTGRFVSAGDRVVPGQLLMAIDSKDASEQLAAAQGAMTAAAAQYKLAESTLARYQGLHDLNAISDLAMDQVRNKSELAGAQLSQAEAAVSRAQNQLAFTQVVADRAGIVGATFVEVGQVVGPGTPVVLIVDDSEKSVHISFTEKQYGMYKVGMPCFVTFWAIPDVKIQGRIKEIAGAPNRSTGTYDVKIDLVSPPSSVVVGMTAEVSFDNNESDSIMVPLSAMNTQANTPSVWVVRDNKVYLQSVETGRYGKDSVEIVSGLSKGDRIVIAGVGRLTEGEEVRS